MFLVKTNPEHNVDNAVLISSVVTRFEFNFQSENDIPLHATISILYPTYLLAYSMTKRFLYNIPGNMHFAKAPDKLSTQPRHAVRQRRLIPVVPFVGRSVEHPDLDFCAVLSVLEVGQVAQFS